MLLLLRVLCSQQYEHYAVMKLIRVMGGLIHNNHMPLAADLFPGCARGERPPWSGTEGTIFLQNPDLGKPS